MFINRRLIYISTVNLLSKKAQSYQIIKFVKSLSKLCKQKNLSFNSYSLSDVPSNYKKYFFILDVRLRRNRLINNLIMISFLFRKKCLKSKDIVYSRDLFILLLLAFSGYKTIYEYHHPTPILNSLVLKIYYFLPNTRVTVISEALKKHFLNRNFSYKKKVLVLPSSVEFEKYACNQNKEVLRNKLGMKENLYYVVHTGSPYEGRGIEYFVQICRASDDIFFIHIGGDKKDLLKLEEKAKRNKIFNYLLLPNISDYDLVNYQKAADLLFYVITPKWPTYWCCSPMKIPEYMASNTPILASSVGSITEMLDEKTSFLFDLNTQSLIDNLMKAKLNPNLGKKIAKKARNKVQKFFTLEIRSTKLINYLKTLSQL